MNETVQKNEAEFQMQSERLNEVVKKLGLRQCDIVSNLENKYSINKSSISKFINGKTKITKNVLTGLHNEFFINPNYINGTSTQMYDLPEWILQIVPEIIDSITITENPNKQYHDGTNHKYLHLHIDTKFYNYLIKYLELNNLKNNKFDLKEEYNKLKQIYKESEQSFGEYVLLPKNVFYNIVDNSLKDEKYFSELIDPTQYSDYISKDLRNYKFKINKISE